MHTTDKASVTEVDTDSSPDSQPPQPKPRPRRQLHGRRMGRAMKASQSMALASTLPAKRLDLDVSAPAPLSMLFSSPVNDVWLEIGFGGGEHLFWQAQNHPHVGFIGCEPFLTGVAKLLRDAQQAGLSNLRIHDDDARQVLEWLPEASIGRMFVLFPDPWPKKRHHKRRFLHASALDAIARVMRPGAHLRFATDIADYADMVLKGMAGRTDFASCPGLHAERPADWPATRYEGKAIKAGRTCQFFSFERV
ncbi:MAG: tRNA (guanosine(46)-N7)-methyltransferase TrmB [Alphaproteobacteria bacterium]